MLLEPLPLHPLEDLSTSKTLEPCVLVIFGATGDLTARKLLPALYNLARDGLLPSHFACVGFARRQKDNAQFQDEMRTAVTKFSRTKPIDSTVWDGFAERLFYHCSEFDSDAGYVRFRELLQEIDLRFGTRGNRIYYLSTPPSYFPGIVQKLSSHGLIYNPSITKDKWSRVVVEKPFGHDITSALQLQTDLTLSLNESQIYRIDHYLGKETVQNLMVFRFANSVFESIWNNKYIDHVQITVSEELGVGTRGRFYEEAGMLRDIVQNHVMQLVSLVAMEPPARLDADAVRDEKVKVLQSIRPINQDRFEKVCVRGQYSSGFVSGLPVKGYREEENVSPTSNIETYVALELQIDNWRWSGVPFYVRAGKRLPKRATEIAVTFKKAPSVLFEQTGFIDNSNVLVIRIQPDEGISLKMNAKVPGGSYLIQPVKMDFRYGSYFGAIPPEAYERLLCDCILGDSTLFARQDEVLQSWKLLTPILERWSSTPAKSFPNYAAGSWGPKEADIMLERSGRRWRFV